MSIFNLTFENSAFATISLHWSEGFVGNICKFSLISDHGFTISKSHREDPKTKARPSYLHVAAFLCSSFTPTYRKSKQMGFVGQWSVVLEEEWCLSFWWPRLELTCAVFLWSYRTEVCGSSWGESQAKADSLTWKSLNFLIIVWLFK